MKKLLMASLSLLFVWVCYAQTPAKKADFKVPTAPNLAQKIFADTKQYSLAIDAAKRALVLAEKQNRTSAVTSLKKRIAEWQQLLNSKP